MKERIVFCIRNSFLNIFRNRVRYIIISTIIFLVSALSYSSLLLVFACGRFADSERSRLEAEVHSMNEEVEIFSDITAAEGIRQIGSVIICGVAAVGGPVLLISVLLMQNSRMYEIGIYRTLGFRKRSIIISMLLEYVLVTSAAVSISAVCGRAAVNYIMDCDMVPNVSGYINGTGAEVFGIILPLIIIMLPAVSLFIKINISLPAEMMK